MSKVDCCSFSMLSEEAKQKAIMLIKEKRLFLSWESVRDNIAEAYQDKLGEGIGLMKFGWRWYEQNGNIMFRNFRLDISECAIVPLLDPKDYRLFQLMQELSNQKAVVKKRGSGKYEVFIAVYSQQHQDEQRAIKNWLSFLMNHPDLLSSDFNEKWKEERFRMRMENTEMFDQSIRQLVLYEVVSVSRIVCNTIAKAYDKLDKRWREEARKTIKNEMKRYLETDALFEYFRLDHIDTKRYRFKNDGSLMWSDAMIN